MSNLENMKLEEVRKRDLENVKEWLKENKKELHYDKEYKAWCLGDDEVLDELWYEDITVINPKNLISDVEEMIEKEILK